MSENDFEPVDHVESVDNVDVVDNVENTESTENDTPAPEPVKEEKPLPWKKPKPEAIPYDRFSEVVSEKNTYKNELEALRKQLEEKNKVPDITIDDLKLEDYISKANTPEEGLKQYQKDLFDLQKKAIFEDFQKRQSEEVQRAEIQRAEQEIAQNFQNKVQESAKINTEIANAVQYLEGFAQYIPAEVRYALVTSDNPGEIAYEIATNEELLNKIITGNALENVKAISKMDAKFEFSKTPKTEPKADVPVIKAMPKKIVETVTGNAQTSSSKPVSQMTNEEYRIWREKRK